MKIVNNYDVLAEFLCANVWTFKKKWIMEIRFSTFDYGQDSRVDTIIWILSGEIMEISALLTIVMMAVG